MKHRMQGEEEKTPRLELFAAANSGKGFYSFYPRVFEREEIEKRYLIWGGPGTGKSSFLRRVAEGAEARGAEVEYYRCSSDPDSLDGIILNGKIAILDATAPHVALPTLPGARDEIVNLGEFWDSEALEKRKNDIVSYSSLKSGCYGKAYRFLSAAMDVSEESRSLVEPWILWEKMERAVRRLLRGVPSEERFRALPALTDSLGIRGAVRLGGYAALGGERYVLEDSFCVGSAFLSLLLREAERKRLAVRVSYDPLCPTLPNGVFLEGSGLSFSLADTEGGEEPKRINMKRFLDPEGVRQIRGEYKRNLRLREGLVQAATDALADAGRYHFLLEKIYVSCMNFEAERIFLSDFCQRIWERL